MIIDRKFYQQDTLKVAQNLLGCFLVRNIKGKIRRAKILETEAYIGETDLASHASRGRTPRTEIMYGEAGHAYVYMIYGMYFCLNVVTEKKDLPAAVLIRSIEINGLDKAKTNGPGKLCRVMQIDKKLNGWDLTHAPKQSLVRGTAKKEKLWIESGTKILPENIQTSKRIGIDYAKHCRHYLWRFYLKA